MENKAKYLHFRGWYFNMTSGWVDPVTKKVVGFRSEAYRIQKEREKEIEGVRFSPHGA